MIVLIVDQEIKHRSKTQIWTVLEGDRTQVHHFEIPHFCYILNYHIILYNCIIQLQTYRLHTTLNSSPFRTDIYITYTTYYIYYVTILLYHTIAIIRVQTPPPHQIELLTISRYHAFCDILLSTPC